MATICIFIGAMEIILVNWFLGLLLVYLLLPVFLHKFRANGLSYEQN